MAKSIMVCGTMSSAGKSFVTAGLCRVFRQDGHRAAPFKSQNMALNSFITQEGLEMGRAQVMQAQAAGIRPRVEMNPILLKPTGDRMSQVIVNGEVFGTMEAKEYYTKKQELIPHILGAYRKLEEEYDILVLEGAGSPAEINLKEQDIVNLGMAKLSRSPVVLVGDIDRGGVFASLAGTLLLLDEEERSMVKGMVINKFRGDVSILEPGLKMLEEITGVPVLGVLPYGDIDLDDEDSLSDRLTAKGKGGLVDIAVIRLPRISNFTDFNPLQMLPQVNLRYVARRQELGNPDLIILPGTKNTMADLKWMRQNGLEAAVLKHAAQGGAVLGICGGYQMLGKALHDPDGVEEGGCLSGMGLLPVTTRFLNEKTRTQVTGQFRRLEGAFAGLSGRQLAGYEIHMGATEGDFSPAVELTSQTGESKGDGAQAGNVLGCYVHGLFDREDVAQGLLQSLLAAKGLDPEEAKAFDLDSYREEQYDKLADLVRQNLDLPSIYRIMEEGI